MCTFLVSFLPIFFYFLISISTVNCIPVGCFGSTRPVRPEQITFSSLQDVSVKISWNIQIGNIDKYIVKYKPAIGNKFQSKNEKVVSVNSKSITLNQLQRDTRYTITITAIREKKQFSSQPIVFQTLKSKYKENVTVKHHNTFHHYGITIVNVSWNLPLNGELSYDVTYELNNEKSSVWSGMVTTSKNTIFLEDLLIDEEYAVTVIATSSKNMRYSSDRITFRTGDAAEYYRVNQFDKLEADDLYNYKIPNRPANFDFNKHIEELDRILKRNYYNSSVTVSRSNIVESTFKEFKRKYILQSMKIYFRNESGSDSGGIMKEWLDLFSAEVFNPKYGLFIYSDKNSCAVEINPKSRKHHPNHLQKFEALGSITAIAISHRCLMNVIFSIPFLKTLLHRPIILNDVHRTDTQLYTTLRNTLKSKPSNMGLTFIAPESTKNNIIKLIENGDEIEVTESNKYKFIRLLINWKYIRSVQLQMAAFIYGFKKIPTNYINILTEDELQVLISGEDKIDINFWQKCTTYINYPKEFPPESIKHIKWFWQAVTSFNNKTRSRILQFVTGSKRFVRLGERKLDFNIYRIQGDTDHLPEGRTCHNELRLPEYSTYGKLRAKLIQVTEFESEYVRP